MKIRNVDEYRRALSRLSELEAGGQDVGSGEEKALLEGAVARYVSQENEPDASKGRPAPSDRARQGG